MEEYCELTREEARRINYRCENPFERKIWPRSTMSTYNNSCWIPPPSGTYKLNVDWTIFRSYIELEWDLSSDGIYPPRLNGNCSNCSKHQWARCGEPSHHWILGHFARPSASPQPRNFQPPGREWLPAGGQPAAAAQNTTLSCRKLPTGYQNSYVPLSSFYYSVWT